MQIDFSKYSSIRIGPIVDAELVNEESEFSGIIIGGANNILLSPNPPHLGILDKKYDFLRIDGAVLTIGAACKSGKIYNFARKNNIANFEFLRGIPGTLGGMLAMNAGLLGREISDELLSVKTSTGEFGKDELCFGYRKSEISGVIFEAKFKMSAGFDESLSQLIAQKRANQPKGASFGSCFANPGGDYAGRLLEVVGLRGFRIKGAGFSNEHANFLINYSAASFDDALALINLAKKRVFEEFGINLREEVRIL